MNEFNIDDITEEFLKKMNEGKSVPLDARNKIIELMKVMPYLFEYMKREFKRINDAKV